MEFIADAGNNGLHHHPFAFEGFILGDTQINFANADIHDLLNLAVSADRQAVGPKR